MANYATLKAAIQQVIKTNGNNEITGALLQQSLLSMINSLGSSYQFVGIATPTLTPGTPDQNVFYIAGPGSYPNFNNTVIPDGFFGVFKYNGSWTIEKTGLQTVVKMPGVNLFDKYDPDIRLGYYVDYNGNFVASANYNASGFIPVEESTTYYCAKDSTTGFRYVAFYDAQKNVIPGTTVDVRSFTTPVNCKFIRVTFFASQYALAQVATENVPFVAYNPVAGYMEAELSTMNQIAQDVFPVNILLEKGAYIKTNDVTIGSTLSLTPIANTGTSYAIIDCNPGDVFILNGYGFGSGDMFAFIDESNKLLAKGGQGLITDYVITAPANSKRVVLNSETYQHTYNIKQLKYGSTVEEINRLLQYKEKQESAFDVVESILNPADPDNVNGKYINPTSGALADGGYNTTGYIPIVPGKQYFAFLKSGSAATIRNLAYFSSTKTVLYGAGTSNVDNFIPPYGAQYVRCSFTNSYGNLDNVCICDYQNAFPYGTYVVLKQSYVVAPQSPATKQYVDERIQNGDILLAGKKIYACGDSYTHGDYTGESDLNQHKFQSGQYAGQNKVWPFFIGQRTGAVVTNLAVNGGRMTTTPGWETTNPSACFSYQLYQQIGADADYIIIKYGINDATGINQGQITLGTITDTSINTFYGAWNTVMSWLVANRPKAKIGIIAGNDIADQNVITAIKEIAQKYGAAMFDEAADTKKAYFYRQYLRTDVDQSVRNSRDNYYKMNADNSHPNDACQEYESTMIEAFIKSL